MGLFDGTVLERPVLCDRCGLDIRECRCPPPAATEVTVEPAKQRVKIRLDKRKRGKIVSLVSGLRGSADQNKSLLKNLKDGCGAGGTLVAEEEQSDGKGQSWTIEIQGDHCSRLAESLRELGYRVG